PTSGPRAPCPVPARPPGLSSFLCRGCRQPSPDVLHLRLAHAGVIQLSHCEAGGCSRTEWLLWHLVSLCSHPSGPESRSCDIFAEDGTATKYFVQLLAEEVATLDMLDLATAKSNLDKALSHLAAAPAGMANVEAQINVEAGKALVKALE
uniref:F1F0-ATP synthase delta subunit C-terminal domain-containing protein n=1 Tax=Gopherus evgoodei TaxID=1825980 RepID=A0A8C4W0D6_9SAUR